MNDKRRVVITGMGIISAIGLDENTVWQNLMEGRTGITNIKTIDVKDCKTRIGAEIPTETLNTVLQQKKLGADDRAVDFALLASQQALENAVLIKPDTAPSPQNISTIFGTGVGSSHSLYRAYMSFAEKGIRGMRPTTVPRCMANATSAQVSMKFRLTGSNYMIVCACASSTTAIGNAFRMIRDGYADIVLAGGTDAVFEPATFASWNNLGVMSKNQDPLKACKPFDSERDGCVLGEGAGALVLESLESAIRRNAKIRGEIIGYGESSDAEHITHPSVEGQSSAIRRSMESASISPADIAFINAHGTATKANDETESKSIRSVFGSYADSIPVVSNKSFLGHLLGASGIAESVISILSLETGILPANLNLDKPDPACNLCLAGSKPQKFTGRIAVKNSFGFGGNNSVLILKKFE